MIPVDTRRAPSKHTFWAESSARSIPTRRTPSFLSLSVNYNFSGGRVGFPLYNLFHCAFGSVYSVECVGKLSTCHGVGSVELAPKVDQGCSIGSGTTAYPDIRSHSPSAEPLSRFATSRPSRRLIRSRLRICHPDSHKEPEQQKYDYRREVCLSRQLGGLPGRDETRR